jgi:hypothetical protein
VVGEVGVVLVFCLSNWCVMKYVYCVMINVVLWFYNCVDKLDSTDNDTSDKVLYTQRDVKYYWSNDDA